MSEKYEGMSGLPEELEQRRLLTEVMHLVNHMNPDGSVPSVVLTDVQTNLFTSVQELAMPSAVTPTIHRVEYGNGGEGRKARTIKWLGKSAVEVAESGYDHHFSAPALKRVDVEVAEAVFAEESLQTGLADVFISPKMSAYDAPEHIAKNENLYEADSIRVSRAVTDASGVVVARRLESLLVTDIPLESWVAMLKDPNNLFGRAFELADERSALSVMDLFRDLRLPEGLLPEGPVTIVQAVLPYVEGQSEQESIQRQLGKFRTSQELYKEQAEQKATEWLAFDLELARSLYQGRGAFAIEAFIASLQHEWGDDDLAVILEHDTGTKYAMTPQLAAVLERAKQNLISSEAALATGNEKVIKQLDPVMADKIIEEIQFIESIRTVASPEEIRARQASLHRTIAKQNLRVGGGCSGDRQGSFRNDGLGPDELRGESDAESLSENSENPRSWKWKKGVCRVEACASPKPTEVGPCSVCRNCQHKFDKGIDPTKTSRVAGEMAKSALKQPDWLASFFRTEKKSSNSPKTQKEVALAA